LQFGTEVVVSEDKSLATLLGASPGASTAVDIMLRIVEQCFPQYSKDAIKKLIPTY
jgi:malate dehydrogenase (quinone)